MKHLALLLLIASMVFTGCAGDAKSAVQDGDFVIEFLFEKDGCKMYRFKDSGRYVYWTDCRGKVEYGYYQSHGKSGSTVYVQSTTNT